MKKWKWKKKTYRYVIELRAPRYPRKLADDLIYSRAFRETLVSVTDLQYDTHMYGTTYVISKDNTQRAKVV